MLQIYNRKKKGKAAMGLGGPVESGKGKTTISSGEKTRNKPGQKVTTANQKKRG